MLAFTKKQFGGLMLEIIFSENNDMLIFLKVCCRVFHVAAMNHAIVGSHIKVDARLHLSPFKNHFY